MILKIILRKHIWFDKLIDINVLVEKILPIIKILYKGDPYVIK
jgi:hypothetical protein